MPTTGYIVAIAPSGRASCKTCKSKIEKGSLRFGSASTAAWDGETVYWRCLTCLTPKVAQNALDFYDGEIASLRGFDVLDVTSQSRVEEVFDGLLSGGGATTTKKSTAAAATTKASDKKARDDTSTGDVAEPVNKAAKKAAKAPAKAPIDVD